MQVVDFEQKIKYDWPSLSQPFIKTTDVTFVCFHALWKFKNQTEEIFI